MQHLVSSQKKWIRCGQSQEKNAHSEQIKKKKWPLSEQNIHWQQMRKSWKKTYFCINGHIKQVRRNCTIERMNIQQKMVDSPIRNKIDLTRPERNTLLGRHRIILKKTKKPTLPLGSKEFKLHLIIFCTNLPKNTNLPNISQDVSLNDTWPMIL